MRLIDKKRAARGAVPSTDNGRGSLTKSNSSKLMLPERGENVKENSDDGILSDAYAGMNTFGAGRFTSAVNEKMEQLGLSRYRSEDQENGVRQTNGPPADRYSSENENLISVAKGYVGKSLVDDPTIYTYDFLTSQPDMNVVMLPDVDSVRTDDGKIDPANIAEKGINNALSIGVEKGGKVYVTNRYTGHELWVTASAIRHGLNGGMNRILTNARLGAVIGNIVQNAIPINALHNTADHVEGTYAMAGYAVDNQGREFVAIVTVEQRTNAVSGVSVYDVTHAVSGRQKRSKQVDTKSQGVNPSMLASEISIADLINAVKSTYHSILPDDVLRALRETRSTDGYYSGRVRYSYDSENADTEEHQTFGIEEADDNGILSDEEFQRRYGLSWAGSEQQEDPGRGERFSFAGEHAKTADSQTLAEAEELERQGADNETIRQETGWFRGRDGKWRFEVDDSTTQVADNRINYMTLGELLPGAEIFNAYQDLKDISVVFQSLDPGVNAEYDRQFDHINVNYKLKNDPEAIRGAVLHEIQHAIQNREGFSHGASVQHWERRLKEGFDSRKASDIREAETAEEQLKRFREEDPQLYRDMMELDAMAPDLPRGALNWDTLEQIEEDPPEWQAYDARRDQLEEIYGDRMWDFNHALYEFERINKRPARTAEELYWDTAGEIEARNVAGRRNLTAQQRKNTPPILGGEDTVFAEGDARSDEYIPGAVSETEIHANIETIAKMDPVVKIKADEFKMGDGRLLQDVTAFFESIGGSVYNERLGDVYLRKRGVRHDLGHGMSDEKAASFAAIPDVLRHGKVAGFVKNKGNKGYDSATVVAPIEIGEVPYMMGVIVHRSNNENRFYIHDVFCIKEEAAPLITGTHVVGETGGATSTISIIRRILDVKRKLTNEGSSAADRFSVDADGELTDEDFARVQAALKGQSRDWAENYLRNELGNEGYEQYRKWEKQQAEGKKQEAKAKAKERNAQQRAARRAATDPVAESKPIRAILSNSCPPPKKFHPIRGGTFLAES